MAYELCNAGITNGCLIDLETAKSRKRGGDNAQMLILHSRFVKHYFTNVLVASGNAQRFRNCVGVGNSSKIDYIDDRKL